MLAGHASGCWLSALGAGMPYNREKNESLVFFFRVPVNKELLTVTVPVNNLYPNIINSLYLIIYNIFIMLVNFRIEIIHGRIMLAKCVGSLCINRIGFSVHLNLGGCVLVYKPTLVFIFRPWGELNKTDLNVKGLHTSA